MIRRYSLSPLWGMHQVIKRSFSHSGVPKPFTDIPEPKGLPLIGTLWDMYKGGAFSGNLHNFFVKRSEQMGPIYREKLGHQNTVFITEPEDVKDFFRNEAKYPERFAVDSWNLHRTTSGRGYGVFLQSGEEWQKQRSTLNRPMMRPAIVAKHLDDFKAVTNDFIQKLEKDQPNGEEVTDMRFKLFDWSLEASLTFLFERRFGLLKDDKNPKIQRFVNSLQTILATSEVFFVFPPKLAKALHLPVWKKHYDSWEELFDIGSTYVTPLIEDAKNKLERGENIHGITANMVQAGNIEDKEILASILTLMSAAIDTTSNSSLWLMILLSKNQDKQQILREEIKSVLQPGEQLSMKHINELRYLKAAIKETLRLHPVLPVLSRQLEEDTIVRGYHIPKGATMVMTFIANRHREDIYKDAEKFRPERWLREGGENPDPHANLPFGFGVRSCIGRRIAELEMQTLFAMLLSKKRIELSDPDCDVRDVSRVLVIPDKDYPIKLIDG